MFFEELPRGVSGQRDFVRAGRSTGRQAARDRRNCRSPQWSWRVPV